MHDWILIQLTNVERNYKNGKLLPYRLIRDCVDLVWPWIYNPFRGYVEDLEDYKGSWKKIESYTWIYIKCAKQKVKNYYEKGWCTFTTYD